MIELDKQLIDGLLEQAVANPRLRQNYDLRTSEEDSSQRMLNALQPNTKVPIHRHKDTTETVICLCGSLVEVLYEEEDTFSIDADVHLTDVARHITLKEVKRIPLNPSDGQFGCSIPKGAWHTVEVLSPSVIFEAKDGKYGEDGSEVFG